MSWYSVLILGFWTLISPWVFGFAGNSLAKWSDVVVGVILILLSIRAIFLPPSDKN